jgi:lipopolysaccharide biosynthesis glycosyltransferase
MNLIYFTVGGVPEYVKLLELCLKSLYRSSLDLKDYVEIMVMCDEDYLQYVEYLKTDYKYIDHIFLTPKNRDHIQVSMRKIEIYSFPDISKYDRVLFLDCDIVILEDIKPFFIEELDINSDKLYVIPELEYHLQFFCFKSGFRKYTTEQHNEIRKNNLKGFNCGQYLFIQNEHMKNHFENIVNLVKTHSGEYFYEQSFMNYYFNLANKVDYRFEKYVEFRPTEIKPTYIIYHMALATLSYQEKLNKMQVLYMQKYIS